MEPLLKPEQAAELLNVDEQILRQWARRGIGPVRIKLGPKTTRYRPEDIAEYLRKNAIVPRAAA